MGSATYCDHISKAPFVINYYSIGNCYHTINVINFCLSQSNHIKHLPLYYNINSKSIQAKFTNHSTKKNENDNYEKKRNC
jgi:hypothetical protein